LRPQLLADLLREVLLRGDLNAAQWLRKQGAEWPHDLGKVAQLTQCHAEAVLWAVRAGCPWGSGWTDEHKWWDEEELCESISHGRRSVLNALHDLGCPCGCPR
jgi:hypothetical protein